MPVQLHIDKLKNKLEAILKIGIHPKDSEIEQYAKYFTNLIAFQSAVIAFIYLALYFFKFKSSISFIYFGMLLLSLVCYLLNHLGYRKLASLYILSLVNALIIFNSLLGGFSMDIHPLMIVLTLCSASILLSFRLYLVYNIIAFVVYVLARNYSTEVGPWLEAPIMPNRHFVNFGFVLVSAFTVSRLIFNTVLKYVNKQQKALDEARGYIKKIENQNKRLEMFNTIAAHDLRTPTRQVISFSGIAKQKNNAFSDKEELEEYLELISKAGFRMKELIDSISVLNSVNQQENKAILPIDLSLLVKEIQPEIAENHGNFKVLQSNLPTIHFRSTHLYLIVQNLMNNAIKFNDKEEKVIQINSSTDAENLFLYFEDNGIGVQEDYKDLIFQPLKKLHIHDVYNGSGLGLYIVSEILTYYDGNIAFSVSESGGSKFTIQFPIALLAN